VGGSGLAALGLRLPVDAQGEQRLGDRILCCALAQTRCLTKGDGLGSPRQMLILGIETSCDETTVALCSPDGILRNDVRSREQAYAP